MRLVLPLPPMSNRYWRYWRGRVVRSPEADRYIQGVRMRALTAGHRTPIIGPVCVNIGVYRKRKAGDLDGFLKVLLDSLQGVAFENDKQIEELHAIRMEDPADPRAVVTVEAMPAAH